MVAVGDADPGVVVATLRQALEALSRLSNERAALEEALGVRLCGRWKRADTTIWKTDPEVVLPARTRCPGGGGLPGEVFCYLPH